MIWDRRWWPCCSKSNLARTRRRFSAGCFGFLFPCALLVQLDTLNNDAVLADLVLGQHVVESVIRSADFAIDPIARVLHHVVAKLIWPRERLIAVRTLVLVRIVVVQEHVPPEGLPPAALEAAYVAHEVLLFVDRFHVNFQLLLYVELLSTYRTLDVLLIRVGHHVYVERGAAGQDLATNLANLFAHRGRFVAQTLITLFATLSWSFRLSYFVFAWSTSSPNRLFFQFTVFAFDFLLQTVQIFIVRVVLVVRGGRT